MLYFVGFRKVLGQVGFGMLKALLFQIPICYLGKEFSSIGSWDTHNKSSRSTVVPFTHKLGIFKMDTCT